MIVYQTSTKICVMHKKKQVDVDVLVSRKCWSRERCLGITKKHGRYTYGLDVNGVCIESCFSLLRYCEKVV